MRLLLICSAVTLFAACDMGKTNVMLHLANDPTNGNDPAGPGAIPPTNVPPDVTCDQGYSYEGFGSIPLVVGRTDEDVGFDRDRIKPLDALRGEYSRVLGTTPGTLDQVANTFGTTPPHWFVEPASSAVSLFSSFRVAFAGCVPNTDTAQFDPDPDPANARAQCGVWAQNYWSRTAYDDELDDCVDTIVNKTSTESSNRLKWAYGCATVLSSAGFLSY